MTDLIDPAIIAYIAGGLFVLAYLVINQVILRLIVIAGTVFYIWYYFIAAETPLWEAIYLSVAMGAANVLGLAGLFARNSRLAIPAKHADIYPRFKDLPPGDFRAVMALATRRTLDTPEVITVEGAPLERLTYVISGALDVEKRGDLFMLPPGVFAGEVAYVTHQPSAATTTVRAGSEVVQWDVGALRAQSRRKDRFRLAMEAMISKDLAAKVAFAVAPVQSEFRQQQA